MDKPTKLRQFSERIAGALHKVDWYLKSQYLNVNINFPWEFTKYICERCKHRGTHTRVFTFVAVEIYVPVITTPEEVEKFLEKKGEVPEIWLGINPNNEVTFIPTERHDEVRRQIIVNDGENGIC